MECSRGSVVYSFKGAIQVLRQHVFGFFRPTHLRQHKQNCKSAKIAIFLTPPTHLVADIVLEWPLRWRNTIIMLKGCPATPTLPYIQLTQKEKTKTFFIEKEKLKVCLLQFSNLLSFNIHTFPQLSGNGILLPKLFQ